MNPPKQDFNLTVDKVDADEKLLAVIKRHPYGIVRIYFQVLIGVIVAGGLVLSVLPELISREENPGIYMAIGIIVMILLGFMVLLLFVATIIYNQSKIVVTDKTITQTIQIGLFNKKVSQLAVSSIEDVTAQKSGIFPTLLNFGRLLIETAGEQENFHFDYCPNADHYAKLILETRQAFMSRHELEIRQEGIANLGYQQQQYAQQPMNSPQPMFQQGQQPAQQPQQYAQPFPPSAPQQPYQQPMPQQSGQQSPIPGTDYPGQT